MKLAAIAVLLCLSYVTNSAPSKKVPADGNTQTQSGTFYHPVDHLDVKDREHLEIDPCLYKVCPPGETCHSVRNPYLLQVPVAVCWAEKKQNDGDDGDDSDDNCNNIRQGTSILNCHTEEEWRLLAEAQCSRTTTSLSTSSAISMFVEVQFACPRKSGRDTAFLQASITCCYESEDQNLTGEKSTSKPLPTTMIPTAGKSFKPSTRPTGPPSSITTPTTPLSTGGFTRPPPTRPATRQPTDSPRTTGGSTSAATGTAEWTTELRTETRTKPTRPVPTTDVQPTITTPFPTEENTVPTEISEEKDDEDKVKVEDELVPESKQAKDQIEDTFASIHHHALWIALPVVGAVVLCAMCCLAGCVLRCYVGRRRQRLALKAYPPPNPTRHSAVNDGYEVSDGEDILYDKKMKPVVVFDPSVNDQLAYDMYIAVKK